MVFENFLLYSELFTTPIRITEEGFHKGAQELLFNLKKTQCFDRSRKNHIKPFRVWTQLL